MRNSIIRYVSTSSRSGSPFCYTKRLPTTGAQLRFVSTNAQASQRRLSPGYVFAISIALYAGWTVATYSKNQDNVELDQQTFTPFILQSKERVSSTASIFTLAAPHVSPTSKRDGYADLWKSTIWSVQAKQPQLQIARNYTPLPPSLRASSAEPAAINILIRKENSGEMSNYLHRLAENASIDLRGPYTHRAIEKEVDSVLFVAGGTGIAPAMQYAYGLLASCDKNNLPTMHILWANRKREDCEGGISDTERPTGLLGRWWSSQPKQPVIAEKGLVVQELEAMKEHFGGRLKIDYFVDEEGSAIDALALANSPALAVLDTKSGAAAQKRAAVLVSGSDGFLGYIAGPKEVRNGFETQGPIRGLLHVALKGKEAEVWKL